MSMEISSDILDVTSLALSLFFNMILQKKIILGKTYVF